MSEKTGKGCNRESIHRCINPWVTWLTRYLVSPLDCLIPEKDVVVYCKAGVRSRMACEALQSIGFNHLFNLTPGMDGWMNTFPKFTHRG